MYKIGALTRSLLTRGAWGSATQALANGSNGSHPPLTPTDFERALTINDRYGGLTVNVPEMPFWLTGGEAFVYRRTTHGEHQFMLVDAATGAKRPAFDQARLAAALNKASHKSYQAGDLPFDRFELTDDGRRLDFLIEQVRWSCDLASYACTSTTLGVDAPDFQQLSHYYTPPAENNPDQRSVSPDGKWIAYIKNYNVFLRSKDGLQDVPLSWDGSEGNYYVFSTLSWSPDSRHVAAYRIRPGYKREIHYVNSSTTDQLQPEYPTMVYLKPGDVLPLPQPVLFDIAGRRQIVIDNALFSNPFELSSLQWWEDGRGFTFEYNQRGHQLYRLVEVDAATGRARSLIDEISKTFVDYQPLVMNQRGTGKTFRYDVDDGKEIIWASERDGYEHLYL
ncbi:DPP IV N-terminal domain-containing protein, partial [Mesorhizobium silamurunense]|uniref:DPP IV N-terminal domain-containing protein n=1 Tax=Mesorhizobium silamurunense TaxID=499528 RepID=UPI00177ADB41